MTAYYNENDPYAAQWLRNLIAAGHIAPGEVDERSIADVRPSELAVFTQCHFFAGIGGWSLALRLAGWLDDRPVWTGSCPCQPFSVSGKRAGTRDERHLWPAWFRLIAERRPPVIFGEQVEAAIAHGWLDLVQTDLEREGYAVGAAVLPAAGVGAPHIRHRLWFVADRLADANFKRFDGERVLQQPRDGDFETPRRGESDELADTMPARRASWWPESGHRQAAGRVEPCVMGDALSAGLERFSGHGDDGQGCPVASGSTAETGQPDALGDAGGEQWDGRTATTAKSSGRRGAETVGAAGRVADTSGTRPFSGALAGIHRGQKSAGLRDGESERPGDDGGLEHASIIERNGRESSETRPLYRFWRDADWLFCRDGKWRHVEPGTFPLAHGISHYLEQLCAIEEKALLEVITYGQENKANTYEILSSLRNVLQQEACRKKQSTGMRERLFEKEVLFTFVLGILSTQTRIADGFGVKKKNKKAHEELLRIVRKYKGIFGTSYKWKPIGQFNGESANPLQDVSRILSRYIPTYWTSAYKANAMSGRTNALRAYGNAVVPHVAAEMIAAYMTGSCAA